MHGWGDLALQHGFSDQSHLIRDFRAIVGTTPRRYVEDATAMAALFQSGELSHSSNP